MASAAWISAIGGYLRAQRLAGYPPTTIGARRQHLFNLAATIAAEPFELDVEQLLDWVDAREWMDETRRSRRTTFISFYRWAFDADLTDHNPAAALPRVRASVPNPNPVPDDVWERAYERADERVRRMMRMAADLGMRRGEIAVAHTRDLFQDLTGWSIRVHGKGKRDRVVELTRRLALDFRSLPTGYFFPGAIDGHLSPRRVGELVNATLEDDWTIHKLRHRAGDRWYRQTGDIVRVQKGLGHANPNTTMHYVRMPNEGQRAMIEEAAS